MPLCEVGLTKGEQTVRAGSSSLAAATALGKQVHSAHAGRVVRCPNLYAPVTHSSRRIRPYQWQAELASRLTATVAAFRRR